LNQDKSVTDSGAPAADERERMSNVSADGAFSRAAPVLHTSRMTLRPLTIADAPHVFVYASQPRFFQYLPHVARGVREAYTMRDAFTHITELQALATAGWPHWAVVPHDLRVPIGVVRFHPAADGSGRAELGYGIGPAWWGRGLATEAATAVLSWAAEEQTEVVARCDRDNGPSRSVLAKLGFRDAGEDAMGRLSFCWTRPKP
jgi:RimJ/RimL family protein N-acetyltransferase